MNKIILTVALLTMAISTSFAQSDWYTTSGSETIFSFPIFKNPNQETTVVRFAPVLNLQYLWNKDFSSKAGFYSGLGVRNVGFIAEDPNDANVRKKFRTYNLGIPIGLKLGNMDKLMLYAGVELEFAFNYKEKTFQNDTKTRDVSWFSSKHQQFMPAVQAGFQFATGMNLKFKYYLNSFFNPDHSAYSSEYERFDANIFYVSLNSNLFTGSKFVY